MNRIGNFGYTAFLKPRGCGTVLSKFHPPYLYSLQTLGDATELPEDRKESPNYQAQPSNIGEVPCKPRYLVCRITRSQKVANEPLYASFLRREADGVLLIEGIMHLATEEANNERGRSRFLATK